jgi:diketogulonate reductase-like aldo/keto reductase
MSVTCYVTPLQVGQLGISNIYDLEALQAIFQQARVKPAVVQNR